MRKYKLKVNIRSIKKGYPVVVEPDEYIIYAMEDDEVMKDE